MSSGCVAVAVLSAARVLAHLTVKIRVDIVIADASFALWILQVCAKYFTYICLFIAKASGSIENPSHLPEVRD